MTGLNKFFRGRAVFAAVVMMLLPAATCPAQDDEGGQIALVTELLGEEDAEMRAVGLQYVRDEIPGEEATRKFAALLPELKPKARAELIEALGDRGDPAALPTVLEMVDSEVANVRTAAVSAVGELGTAEQVPLLAALAASDDEAAAAAAHEALVQLKGDGVDQAVMETMAGADPELRAAMIRVLAGRDAGTALPEVIEAAGVEPAVVRLAALDALRRLADPDDAEAVVNVLRNAPNKTERRKARLALLTICSRGRQQCAGPIVAAVGQAEPAAQVALLPALARAGGPEARQAVIALTGSDDPVVSRAAVSTLATWPDRQAAERLKELADAKEPTPEQVVALRGLVRMAGPSGDQPADVAMLGQAFELARRTAERRLVIAALGRAGTMEAVERLEPMLDDPPLREAAAAAVVVAAEQLGDEAPGDRLQAVLKRVLEVSQNKMTRSRAKKATG
ncbi:MAG: HEAT repeat domain-containing protein [Pirellulales bacterium]